MRRWISISFLFLGCLCWAQSSLLLRIDGLENVKATFYLSDTNYSINAQNTQIDELQPGDYDYHLKLLENEIRGNIYLKLGDNSLIIQVPELGVQLNRVDVSTCSPRLTSPTYASIRPSGDTPCK